MTSVFYHSLFSLPLPSGASYGAYRLIGCPAPSIPKVTLVTRIVPQWLPSLLPSSSPSMLLSCIFLLLCSPFTLLNLSLTSFHLQCLLLLLLFPFICLSVYPSFPLSLQCRGCNHSSMQQRSIPRIMGAWPAGSQHWLCGPIDVALTQLR